MQCRNKCHNRRAQCGKVVSPTGSLSNQRGAENLDETEPIRAQTSEREGRVRGGRHSGARQDRQVPFLTSRGRSEHVCSMKCSKMKSCLTQYDGCMRGEPRFVNMTNKHKKKKERKKIWQATCANTLHSNPLFHQ